LMTWFMFATLPTEVPPNFKTRMALVFEMSFYKNKLIFV